MLIELGAGQRPTKGYTHLDIHPFPHVEIVGEPWMVDCIEPGSVHEVLALAFIEHLSYEHALDTFRAVREWLHRDGLFLFDVPDYPRWAKYYLFRMGAVAEDLIPADVPTLDHVRRTLFGWQRWPGDEHLYGWDEVHLAAALRDCGFDVVSVDDVEPFKARAYRQRFDRPWDAHLYVTARPE
jgi:predicted SAM-dependent methyltransferase